MKHAFTRVAAVLAGLSGATAVATETTRFKLLERFDDLELREYPSYVVAETEVAGEQAEVGSEAFSRLAGYIFGNNRGAQKIAMTAPVTQAPAEGTKIAMTAPVTQQQSGARRWNVQFMMPSVWSLEKLPEPTDARVHLRAVPPKKVAAIRYSGTWSQANYLEHLSQLKSGLTRHGLLARGEPVWARYDPPYKPWFLRSNEILIEVDEVP